MFNLVACLKKVPQFNLFLQKVFFNGSDYSVNADSKGEMRGISAVSSKVALFPVGLVLKKQAAAITTGISSNRIAASMSVFCIKLPYNLANATQYRVHKP